MDEIDRVLQDANNAAKEVLPRAPKTVRPLEVDVGPAILAGVDPARYEREYRRLLAQRPHLEELMRRDPQGCRDAEWLYLNRKKVNRWLKGLGPEGDALQHPTDIRRSWMARGNGR